MRKTNDPAQRDYEDYIVSALRTEGGHLSIGRGGFTLYYARGATLSGYDCESIKACCIAAGVPVIDSRMVAFEDVVRLAVSGTDGGGRRRAKPAAGGGGRPLTTPSPTPRSCRWRTPIGRPEPRCSTLPGSRWRRRQKSESRAGIPVE